MTVAVGILASAFVGPMAVSAAPGDCSLNPGAGGTYRVTSQADLQILVTNVNCLDESLVQTADITLTVSPWVPISNFVGSYDGGGREITGLVLSGNEAGLFNVGAAGASFSNLDISVANSTGGGHQVGALVGESIGSLTIVDVDVTGNVSGSGSDVGGVVGVSTGSNVSITGSQMNGNVTGGSNTGGVLGSAVNAAVTVSSSPVVGDVNGTGNNSGGIVGVSTGTSLSIIGSGITGNVSGSAYVGGILGFNPNGPVTISSSPVVGNVTSAGNNSGGVVGMHTASQPLSITSSPVTAHVSGANYVGGIVGFSTNAAVSISSSPVVGNVTGSGDDVGGAIGFLGGSSELTLTQHSVTGDVTGADYVGGLVGYASEAPIIIESGVVDGNVTGAGDDVGGLIGFTGGPWLAVTDSTVSGNLVGERYVGGLVGFSPNAAMFLDSNSVVGDVTAIAVANRTMTGQNVGGLVGYKTGNQTTILTNNRYTGDVLGTSYVGGLVGFFTSPSIALQGNTVTGNVTGTAHPGDPTTGQNVGGLLGTHVGLSSLLVSTSRVVGDVRGRQYVGGLVGFVPSASVSIVGASVEGDVIGTVSVSAGSGAQVGGLLGSVTSSSPVAITSTYVSGMVSGSAQVGGLIGFLPVASTSVSATAFVGSVIGSGDEIGGFVGVGYGPLTITTSFVRGSVIGADDVGGLWGWINNSIDVHDSYVHATVNATGTDEGSFGGKAPFSGVVTLDETFCTDSLCSFPNLITVAQLQSTSFLESRGWDFANVWCLKSSVNDGFPVLRAVSYVAFTGCWAVSTPSIPMTPIWRATLDPNGGVCREGATARNDKWQSVFVGYRYLPGKDDCERDGFTFEGWADTDQPDELLKLPVLVDPKDGMKRAFLTSDADVVAIWKRVDEADVALDDLTGTAPGVFVGGPDRRTREGGGVVDGYYIPPRTVFGAWMLAK